MGRRKKTVAEKLAKKTPVKLKPIPKKNPKGEASEPWVIMERLREDLDCFASIREANIRMYWSKDWKPDVDGVVVGAMCAKASEKDRLAAEEAKRAIPDADIILPLTVWPGLDQTEKEHRVFHELCHIRFALDSKGETKRTTKDWPVVRLRRHPITAFPEEVERYGAQRILGRWLEMTAASIVAADGDRPLLRGMQAARDPGAAPGGWRTWDVEKLQAADRKITDAKIKNLHAAGLDTLGELADKMDRESTWWHKGTGIGAEYAQRIADVVATIRAKAGEREETAT